MTSGLATWAKTPETEREPLQRVQSLVQQFEDGVGRDFKEKCDRLYRSYRGFKRYKNAAAELIAENDRDQALLETADKYWGSNLHIPYGFATVETMVPRAIAQRPRMLYLPKRERWQANADNVQMLVDGQADAIDIDLTWQDVMRDGFVYGVGFGKCYWRREYISRRRVKRRMLRPSYVVGSLERELIFDDPDFDWVDPLDMAWDWFGRDPQSCRWMSQRLWMGLEQCMDRVKSGTWNTESAKMLTEEDIRGVGSPNRYDETYTERLTTAGFPAHQVRGDQRGEQIHEVWEFHDGDRVLTVLDRSVLVQDVENPCPGMKPFVAYTPTPQNGLLAGVGEIEPIDSLSRELDTLRSMQLDAGVLALTAGYAFDEGSVERDDLEWGPNAAIPVQNARPQDAIWPLPKPELPNSSFQNVQAIMADIERVSGLNDALSGGDGGSISTATEAQLVSSAVSHRIGLKSRRFEVQVCRPVARMFLRYDQRMILEAREVRQPEEGLDPIQAASLGRWRWVQLGPGEIQGEFEITPEGGTLAAQNIPQDRQDAQILGQLEGNPNIDQRALLLLRLRKMGIKDPEALLAQQRQPIPPEAIEILLRARPDMADTVQRAIQIAQRANPTMRPQTDAQLAEEAGTMAA